MAVAASTRPAEPTANNPEASDSSKAQIVGNVPPRKLTRKELLKTHKKHVEKQDRAPNAPRPVKQPFMHQAYPASTKSIRDLEIVCLFPII